MRLRRRFASLAALVLLALAAVMACSVAPEPSADGRPTADGHPTPDGQGSAPADPDPGAPGQAGSAAPQPQVAGADLIDARTGEVFIPRGVNWSGFEYPCAQGWAYSEVDRLANELGRTLESEVATLRDWSVNTVRLNLNQDCWLGRHGAPVSDAWETRSDAGYRERVIEFVTRANEAGMVVIIDLHSRKRPAQHEFGNLAMPDSDSVSLWTSVAETFRDHPSVLFDLFNEPYSRYDEALRQWAFELSWLCWRDGGCRPPLADDRELLEGTATYEAVGMAELVAAVRATGAAQPLLLSGLDYANDLSQWATHLPDDDQLVAAFHGYDFKACATSECWDQTLAGLADQFPLVVAELGQGDPASTFVTDFLDWSTSNGVGVLAWAWTDHAHDPMSLLQADRETPTTAGRVFRDHFIAAGPSS